MSHSAVSLDWIAAQARVHVRTVQRAAANGEFDAPRRKADYQRSYPLTPSLEEWIKKKRLKKGRESSKVKKAKAVLHPHQLTVAIGRMTAKRWLQEARKAVARKKFDWWGYVANDDAHDLAFLWLAAHMLQRSSSALEEVLWKSPETIEKEFGNYLGKTFGLKLAKFLRLHVESSKDF